MAVATTAGKKLTALYLRALTPLNVTKTADESVTSNATPQNDNELFLPCEANAVYRVLGYIRYSSTSATPDLRVDFTAPAGATLDRSVWGAPTTVTGPVTTVDVGSISTIPGDDDVRGTHTAGILTCLLMGTLITSAATGTLQLRWAQGTSDAAAVVVRAGSWLEIHRTA